MNDAGRDQFQEDADAEFPTRRRWLKPIAIIGFVALVALIVAGSITAAHVVGEGVTGPGPTPTATAFPRSDLFYIQESPPWGSVTIDGHTLDHLPTFGSGKPLQLSPGIHQVVWHADPFPPQHCAIFVPDQHSETSCLGRNAESVRTGSGAGLSAWIITFSASLADLPSTQRAALAHATQAALDSLQSIETVRPGERYVDLQANQFVATAAQPLHATLHFQLDTTSSYVPCAGALIDQSFLCANNGHSCYTFCLRLEIASDTPLRHWDVFGVVRPTWQYTTLDGRAVAQDQPDAPDNSGLEYAVALYITWDSSKWHVTVSPPNDTSSDVSNNPACAAAQHTIARDSNFISAVDTSRTIMWKYISGQHAATGCLAEAIPQPDTTATPGTSLPKPIAYCLYRFGVLLAVDNAAHLSWPGLPVANAYEKSVAQQLATLT